MIDRPLNCLAALSQRFAALESELTELEELRDRVARAEHKARPCQKTLVKISSVRNRSGVC